MGIHDRDYVRKTEFDYKKMEYVVDYTSSKKKNTSNLPLSSYKYFPLLVLILLSFFHFFFLS